MAGYLTANDTPGRHPSSWYTDTAGEMPDHPSLAGESRADVCVVGGGYAGLSAALHLAERGFSVALVEANRIGWGASGRNGGQLGTGPRADIRVYEAKIGRDDARKVWGIALAANRLVRDLIARHAIDCDLTDGGMEAAWKSDHAAEIANYAEHVARHYGRDDLTVIPREAMGDWLGTQRYHGGLHEGLYAHLHPLRLALGLGRAAAAAGARIFEQSRVTRVSPGRVETAQGAVSADHVILAMNGYLDGLVPAVQARSMPINNFIAVTEPLGKARAQEIIKGPFCVSDTKFVLNYYRMTPDHRLLWGGGESYGARFPADIAGLVRSKMLEIFPQLSGVKLTHAWGGTLAITAPRMPAFQRIDAQTLAVSGWSGSGIHMATMGGQIAAEAIAGQMERWDVMARLPIPAFPGGDWFRAPLLALAMTWYSLRDRM
ncbi:FAD-binding oxidoreductase [Limibaculum sp. FT325]|uniref:NAD(P)/FAD-dependent oxidoreductase n=1 Tax=Thermohalobaculum sediminis TaxID=2939436 RepID=UPI0020C11E43|nr:FAD-binding oxidoreductase [Limibaculum sediminis]MCL5777987.1 FAD-binding oxidoreductase [Limibaculum sediminis]